MNDLYIDENGKKHRVGLPNVEAFLVEHPTAKLFVEEETMGPEENPNVEGKPEVAATPVASAVTEDTASQSGVGSLELQESKYKTPLTLEEKKSLQNNKFSKQMSKENNFTKERLLELQNPQDNGFSYRNEMTLDEQIQDHKKVSKEIMTGTAAYDKDFFKQYNKEDRENLVKLGKPNYVTTLPKYNSDGSLSEDMSYVFTTQALKDINSNIDTSKKEYETTKTELEEGLDYKQKQKQRSQSLFNDLWKNDTYVNEVLYPEIITSSEKEIAEAFLDIVPCHDRIKFAKNGSCITTAATKLARAHTGRKLVAFPADHPFYSYDDWFIAKTPCNKGIPEEITGLSVTFNSRDLQSLIKLFEDYPNQIACVIWNIYYFLVMILIK